MGFLGGLGGATLAPIRQVGGLVTTPVSSVGGAISGGASAVGLGPRAPPPPPIVGGNPNTIMPVQGPGLLRGNATSIGVAPAAPDPKFGIMPVTTGPGPLQPVVGPAYDPLHAVNVSVGAGVTAVDNVTKTADKASELTQTGISKPVNVVGDLAGNAVDAASKLIGSVTDASGKIVGGAGDLAGGIGGAASTLSNWLPWILGAAAVGGVVYIGVQTGVIGKRSRRSQE